MPTLNISVFRKDLFNSIDRVIEYNEPITINTKRGNAVILSEEDYNALIETLYLSMQKDMVDRIKKGENEDINTMPEYDPNEEW